MGKYRFRLSDMIPNAWFYKLKDMNKTRNWKNANPSKKKQQNTTLSSVAAPIQAQRQLPHLSDQRKSYHFTRDLNPEPNTIPLYTNSPSTTPVREKQISEPARESLRRRRSMKRIRKPSVQPSSRVVKNASIATGCRCGGAKWTKPYSTPEEYPNSPNGSSSFVQESLLPEYGSDRDTFEFDGNQLSWSTSCRCRNENNAIIDMESLNPFSAKSDATNQKLDGFVNLPPIITRQSKTGYTERETKPTKIIRTSAKFDENSALKSLSVKVVKEDVLNTFPKEQQTGTNPIRRFPGNSQGLRLRTNSPRLAVNRRIQGRKSASSTSSSSSRRSISESFAVVKSSQNPQRDFRESMVEMIVENNIKTSKDLEELLACYLSLNSDEYHDLIINVFKKIWFDIIDI